MQEDPLEPYYILSKERLARIVDPETKQALSVMNTAIVEIRKEIANVKRDVADLKNNYRRMAR